MQPTKTALCLAAAGVIVLAGCAGVPKPAGPQNMTFFVTSVNPGKGADFGGLAGADAHCTALAKAAGAPDRGWRAYLSTQGSSLTDTNVVNARDRIGTGPWQNAKGVIVAYSVDDLHASSSNLRKETALSEKGSAVNSRTEKPNEHDILTGSRPDGTAYPGPFGDLTCANWTKGSKDGIAMVGHFDRAGPLESSWAMSWNSSHPTRGCDMESLRSTGGGGLIYCFATK